MNIESFRDYCLSKPGVIECYPFDETTLVFKVVSKMFALTDIEDLPFRISLKFTPEGALEARENYDAVQPAFHMNKTYWNMIIVDDSIPERELEKWIDDSYDLVAKGLKKKEKEELAALSAQPELKSKLKTRNK
ncbi:MAG: MmcQ/YjbR family DNA-binding protein [Methanococcaceae archaeon]